MSAPAGKFRCSSSGIPGDFVDPDRTQLRYYHAKCQTLRGLLCHPGMILPLVKSPLGTLLYYCRYIIGHYDERSGFWQIENNLNYRFTPYSEEMLTSIREIKKQLEKKA